MLDIVSLRDITDLKKLCNHGMFFAEGSVVVYIDTDTNNNYSL
jgi:hypothetical protein